MIGNTVYLREYGNHVDYAYFGQNNKNSLNSFLTESISIVLTDKGVEELNNIGSIIAIL